MTSYEAVYGGGDNMFMPKYNATGHGMDFSQLGMATDPRSANQLGAINTALNPGTKRIEVGALSGEVMESIPEQHLDEIRRLAKMAGVKPSFHAPIVEASGVGEKGWEEANRLGAEQQLTSAVSRAHKIDPEGNISVTVHSTAGLPEMESKIKQDDGKEVETGDIWIVNSKTGQFQQIPRQERFFPEEGKEGGKFEEKGVKFDYDKELERINKEQWSEGLSQVNRMANYGDEIVERLQNQIVQQAQSQLSREEIPERKKIAEKLIEDISKGMEEEKGYDLEKLKQQGDEYKDLVETAQREITHGQIYLKDAYRSLKTLFDTTYSTASDKDKKKLAEFAESIQGDIKPGIESNPTQLKKLGHVVNEGLKVLQKIKTAPKTYERLQPFVIDKSSETFANVAERVYKEHGSTAPMINIENPPAGSGLSRAEDLRDLIKASREKLVGNLSKKGMDKSQAKKISEKMIGATWDVGHINMLRKKGYSEKDIVKQSEIIAPYVKHVHLSDNFGLDHTELPMGMGNVPIKEIMGKLGKKGFEASKIIEAGNWWQYFAEHGGGNPLKPTIENFDSPIYAMKAGPTWSEAGSIPGYYLGHGPVNPGIHHRIYNAGFEALPVELGGELPGDQNRFSGTPNQ